MGVFVHGASSVTEWTVAREDEVRMVEEGKGQGFGSKLTELFKLAVLIGLVVAVASHCLYGTSPEEAVAQGGTVVMLLGGSLIVGLLSLAVAALVAALLGIVGGVFHCLWTGQPMGIALMGYVGGLGGGVVAFVGLALIGGAHANLGGLHMLLLVGTCVAGGWLSAHFLRNEA